MFFSKKDKSSVYSLMLVGLGNPGEEYEKTRHNAGFNALDALAQKYSAAPFKAKNKALVSECKIGSQRVLLVKPQTYMNLSGEAVAPLKRFYKMPIESIFVMFDDISLPVGNIRIRKKGSAGGHNGVKSLIAHLSTQDFARLKIGVGAKPSPDADLKDWVLGGIPKEQQKDYNAAIEKAVNAVEELLKNGIDSAMNKYNS